GGVSVFDIAGEEPADGLQAGVGMRGYVHASGGGDVVGSVVVGEAPGSDEAAAPLREGAPHGHGAGPAEGNIAGLEKFDVVGGVDGCGGCGAGDEFFGVVLEVAHRGMLT